MTAERHGRISLERIAEGIRECLTHGAELVVDARTMQDLNRPVSAAILGGLALEELGKIHDLRKMVIFAHNDQTYWRPCWREFLSSHAVKAAFSMHDIPSDALTSAASLEACAKDFEEQGDIAIQNRERFMYVEIDWLRDRWVSPQGISLDESAKVVVRAEEQLEAHSTFNRVGAYSAEFLSKVVRIYSNAIRLKVDEEKRRTSHDELASAVVLQSPCWSEWAKSLKDESKALLGLVENSGNYSHEQIRFLKGLITKEIENPGADAPFLQPNT